jgi:Flp pilus assembly protein TadG
VIVTVNRRSKSKGSILIVTCLSMVVIAGIAGLAVDAGRMYVARNELRSFADSAALSAALQLDGTSEGIAKARAAAASASAGANKWDMATKAISNVTIKFAKGADKTSNRPDDATWSTSPADPASYRFARVVASVDVPMILMRRGTSAVVVSGTAGQMLEEPLPVTAIAPEASESRPVLYTLQYPSGGDKKTSGDLLNARLREDSDPFSRDYAAYTTNAKGNGRRVVGLSINDGTTGMFFLQAVTGSAPARAEYIGPLAQSGGQVVRLVQ